MLEAAEAVAAAARAVGPAAVGGPAAGAAAATRAVVDEAVRRIDAGSDARAHDVRGLPTAAEWGRRVAIWGRARADQGVATIDKAMGEVRGIPEVHAAFSRALARAVASGGAQGAYAARALEAAYELDARAATEALGAAGRDARTANGETPRANA